MISSLSSFLGFRQNRGLAPYFPKTSDLAANMDVASDGVGYVGTTGVPESAIGAIMALIRGEKDQKN